MTIDSGEGTARQITSARETSVEPVDQPLKLINLNRIAFPVEGTMVPERITMDPATPFGGAVQPIGGGRIKVNTAKIKRIYELTASEEKKRQDRKTCGMLHSDFTPDQSEYEDGRYE